MGLAKLLGDENYLSSANTAGVVYLLIHPYIQHFWFPPYSPLRRACLRSLCGVPTPCMCMHMSSNFGRFSCSMRAEA